MYKKIFRNMCMLAMITVLVASVFILSACYTSFNTKYDEELQDEVELISGFADTDNPSETLQRATVDIPDKYIVLFDRDGNKVYFNSSDSEAMANISVDMPGISEARAKGRCGWQSHTFVPFRQIYYYAKRLGDGSVLCVSTVADGMNSMFYTALIAVIFVCALIYLLCVIVAFSLTENIVNPIRKIRLDRDFDLDGVYEEIKPMLARIAKQNKEITHQMENVKTQKIRLRAIADTMNDGLVVMDGEGAVMSVNEYALDIFSLKESDIKYRSFENITHMSEIRDCIRRALEGARTNATVAINDKTYQIFCSGMRSEHQASGAVMLLFDVSETARAEEIRREFTANVSHELKTPLTSIHGYAQIINSGIAKPEDVGGFVAKIEKESNRLITLIDDIIRLSKLDEGGDEYDRQYVDVKAVADEVAEQLAQKARARDISIDVSGAGFVVHMNPGQLTQLVYNLCDNAIKYNKDGGKVCVEAGEGVLTVADTGIGIAQEYTDRIFERFFRVDKSRSKKVDGTGLGLSIVKHIAQKNNIEISVHSVPGEGTRFVAEFVGEV